MKNEDERDIAEARAASTPEALTARWTREGRAGLHVESSAPFTLGAAAGYEIRLRLDARSTVNRAPFDTIDWIRILWVHGRYFKLDCAAAADQWNSCERVLNSFALER
jgi:hypothetical protein